MVYQLDTRRDIRGQNLIDATVALSEDDCHGLVDCTLMRCTLKLAQPSGSAIIIVRCTIIDSDVIAVKRQKNDRLFGARFINCRFHGVYSGIDFGRSHWPNAHGDFGAIQDCDFTDATLDDCRFFNTDMSSIRLPHRDHAVLMAPGRRVADVAALEWPGLLGKYMQLADPESVSAVVMHIPSLARLVRCTKEEVRAAFEKFGGLVM